MIDFPSHFKRRPTRSPSKPLWISKGKLVFVLVTFFILAMFFVLQRTEFIRTEKRVRALTIQKRQLLFELQSLQLEDRYRNRLDKIEQQAQEKLSLHPPEKSQIISVPLSTSP